jgi:hypothetical protein
MLKRKLVNPFYSSPPLSKNSSLNYQLSEGRQTYNSIPKKFQHTSRRELISYNIPPSKNIVHCMFMF